MGVVDGLLLEVSVSCFRWKEGLFTDSTDLHNWMLSVVVRRSFYVHDVDRFPSE